MVDAVYALSALVVVESWFGGTRYLTETVAATLRASGITTSVADVDLAPTSLPDGTGLLVVAAPTRDRGLPTPESGQAATNRSTPVCRRAPAYGSGRRGWHDPNTRPWATDLAARVEHRRRTHP